MFITKAYATYDISPSGSELMLKNPDTSVGGSSNWWETIDWILTLGTDILLTILPIIALSVLLWVAYELFTAGWNEEKWKKAWKTLVYMIVGLVVTMAAYALVRMVAWISF